MKRLPLLACLALVLGVWLAYALLGHPLAAGIAARWGDRMVRAGDGLIFDAAGFLQRRFFEVAWLLTVTAGLALPGFWLGRAWAQRCRPLWRWIPFALISFLALNLWIHLAAGTCLFWCLFWTGKDRTHNLTQFEIKLQLMEENRAPFKAVLGGSSQVRAQIDHRALNRQLGSNIFVTQLHFPGSRAYDFLFLDEALAGRKADAIVCYLSELNFFTGGISDGFSLFFNFRELPEFARLGGRPGWGLRSFSYGLLGHALPLFRVRDPVTERLLGPSADGLGQVTGADLEKRARESAGHYRMDEQSAFQEAAFETFVARCRAKGRTVVLCCGQLNPLLSRQLDPALRPRMEALLRRLAKTYDNVVLLEEKDLPRQTEAEYEDLTHANAQAKARYTDAIGRVLQELAERRKSG